MTLRKQLLIYSDFYHFSESQYDAMNIDIQDEDWSSAKPWLIQEKYIHSV